MLGQEFSIVMAVILGALSVVFFLGKGAGVMDLFQGKNAPPRKKRSPEDERRYQRVFGVFCLVLFLNEMVNVFFGQGNPIFGIITIVVVVADLAFVIVYLRKNFPE